jgi:predicted ATPase
MDGALSHPKLSIRTLGEVSLWRDGERITELRSTKAVALLVYLAETGHLHRRSALAGLLWTDRDEAAARNNLRQTLTALRKVVPDHLLVDGDQVGISGDYTIDTRPIEADGYRGDFLAGLAVLDAQLFEEWVQRVRSAHAMVAASVFETAATQALHEGDIATGLAAAHRILDLEPWNEVGHRLVMRLLAADDRIPEAVEQYDRCAGILRDELGVEPSAETQTLLTTIEANASAGETMPHATTLPVPATLLFGRESELDGLTEALSDGHTRLISIVGPGGIGKTRLAAAVADRVRDLWGTDVTVVSLEGTTDPDRVPHELAAACEMILVTDRDPLAQIAARLAGREMLIVIDNAEQVAEAVGDAASALLSACPHIRMLVTSRVVLNVASEHVFLLDGLAVDCAYPDSTSPAVELFVDRARRVLRSFEPDATTAEICHMVGGMPLAIELAARLVAGHRPTEIRGALQESIEVLATDLRDVPDRQRSMASVLEQSWARLRPADRRLMARLSVCRGGFDRAAAVAVAGASPAALQRLVGRTLLSRRADGRFEIHELIRQFAAGKLSKRTGDREEALRDHARHFLSVLVDAETALSGANAREATERLIADIDNIDAAWLHTVALGDHRWLVRAGGGLYRLCQSAGRMAAGVDLFEWAADAADPVLAARASAYQLALAWHETPIEICEQRYQRGIARVPGDTAEERRARVMLASGFGQALAEQSGDIDRSRKIFVDALHLVEDLDDPDLEAFVRVAAAKTETTSGHFDTALALLDPAAERFRQTGNMAGAAETASRMAMAYAEQYRVGPALRWDIEALEAFDALGNHSRAAHSAGNVGASYVLVGDWIRAESYTLQALAMAHELGDSVQLPYLECQLAEVKAGAGDRAAARELFVSGIAGIRHSGFSLGLRLKLPEWGRFLVEDEKYVQAQAVLDEGRNVWASIGGEHFLTTVEAIIARARLGQGHADEAAKTARRVWRDIKQVEAAGLPYPIESMVDCLYVFDAIAEKRLAADVVELAGVTIRRVLSEIADPHLRETFLNLPDCLVVLNRSNPVAERR